MSTQQPPQKPPAGNQPAAPATAPATPSLLVEAIMTAKVHTINTDMTLRQVTQELLKHQIAGAPVTDQERRVITVVSEGDLLRLAASMGLDKTIYQCLLKMTKADKLVTVKKEDTFADAYRKFLSHSVHRLIVVDEKGRLEGIVSRSNVLKILSDPQAAAAAAPSTPAAPAAKKTK